MANQFIKDVGTEVVRFDTPSFVNSGASNADIVRGAVASTSGNNFLDIAINKAINYSQKLDVMKANNEKAKHSIELQKNLQDYENMWQESGNNKYSDENYSNYLSGLNEIYDTAKMNFATTKYTRESDVLNWENSLDEDRNKTIFMQNGEKARFDIQAVTDETLMNVSAMANNYIMNGNYQELSDAVMLLDGLSDFIPKHQLDEMKRKQVMIAEKSKMENDMSNIVNNPSMSIDAKRQALTTIQNKIGKSKDAYEYMAKQAVEMGLYSDLEVAKSDYQMMYQESLNKNGGIIGRLDEQIRDEKYRNDVALANYIHQTNQQISNDLTSIKNSLRSGDDFKAIGIIEGRDITGYDLMDNPQLSEKYYDATPHEVLYNKQENGVEVSSGKYIPTLSLYEINQIKSKNRIDETNMIPRNEQVVAITENMSNLSADQKENMTRELVANGVATQLEMNLIDGRVRPNTMSSAEMIDYAHIGSKSSKYNKTMNFTGANPKSPLGKMVQDLDFYERQQLSEMLVGAIQSGRFGTAFGGKEITQGTVNSQMAIIGEFMQDSIDVIKSTDKTKYQKAQMNIKDNIDDVVTNRYKNKPLHLRETTKESGVNYIKRGYGSLEEEF